MFVIFYRINIHRPSTQKVTRNSLKNR